MLHSKDAFKRIQRLLYIKKKSNNIMENLKHLFTSILFLLCSTVATAHEFEVNGIFYNITDETNKTVEVTYKGNSYNEYSKEYTGSVVIPENVTYNGNTYSVTSIGGYACSGCSGLTSVTIGNSVTSIGDYAFYYCDGLKEVHISDLSAWCLRSLVALGLEVLKFPTA